jgi:hypothetical protein
MERNKQEALKNLRLAVSRFTFQALLAGATSTDVLAVVGHGVDDAAAETNFARPKVRFITDRPKQQALAG